MNVVKDGRFWIGVAVAVAVLYGLQMMRARKAASQ